MADTMEKTLPIPPIDPMREDGIRLWADIASKTGSAEVGMILDLLTAIDRLRLEAQSLRTELSVHERRVRMSKLSMFTDAEEGMLRLSVDAGSQIVAANPARFSEADVKAMAYLREMVAVS